MPERKPETAPKRSLEDKLEDQRQRDKGRSPLLTTLQSLEKLHGIEEVEKAFKQLKKGDFPAPEPAK